MTLTITLPDNYRLAGLEQAIGRKAISWTCYLQHVGSNYLQGRSGFTAQDAIDAALKAMDEGMVLVNTTEPMNDELTLDDLEL